MPSGTHVKIIIHTDGSCAIDALNFTDATCTQATQQITAALGGQVIQDRLKPEARNRQSHAAGDMEPSR
jgi:hypothetical protein